MIALGIWCLPGGRPAEKASGIEVAAPLSPQAEQRDRDHAAVRTMEARVFPDFCRAMNAVHGGSLSERAWRILCGAWFRNAVAVIYNRTRTLRGCLEAHEPTWTIDPVHGASLPTHPTSDAALWAFSDPSWDGHLALRILDLIAPQLSRQRVKGPVAVQHDPHLAASPGASATAPLRRRALLYAWKHLQAAATRFVRPNDAFVIQSYLPRRDELLLQHRLGQVPQLWRSPRADVPAEPDATMRASALQAMGDGADDEIERVLRRLLLEIIPRCYLEGLSSLMAQAQALPWPKQPRLIFTSNSFGTDELFKAWTAMQVDAGVPYIVGQHGNNYGTHRYMNPSVEESTSDRFVTWGWSGSLSQHCPGFNLKVPARMRLRTDSSGAILLVQVWAGHRITPWDTSVDFERYMQDQFSFVSGMSAAARALLKVRLHHDCLRLGWDEPGRWRAFDPSLSPDLGLEPIAHQIRRARLIVHSYDSTGMLETMSLDLPTLAFWQNGLNHLRDEVREDYQMLVDVGIVHLSAASAAQAVNAILVDVRGWWQAPERQRAVRRFCERYSRRVENPSRELAALLGSARSCLDARTQAQAS